MGFLSRPLPLKSEHTRTMIRHRFIVNGPLLNGLIGVNNYLFRNRKIILLFLGSSASEAPLSIPGD